MAHAHPLYNCSQQNLYIAATMGWENYADNQAAFKDFKGKYTPAYGTNALAEMLAAKALPDSNSRNSIPETLRDTLVPLADTCLYNWNMLKSYIEEVYEGSTEKTMIRAAGGDYYKKARKYDWSEVDMMNQAATTFIANHTTELQKGTENMPATFVAKYASGKTAFDAVYKNFLQAQQATGGGTDAKIIANNNVYKKLIAMQKDGRLIFDANESKKDLFTFDTLLSFISGTGASGFKLWVIDSLSELPITDYKVNIQPGDITEVGGADGTLEKHLSENVYSFTLEATGYDVYRDTIRVTTGTVSRKKIKLVKPITI
jgi:hypothetical protein